MWLEVGHGFNNTIEMAKARLANNITPRNISKPRWKACVNQLFNNHGVEVNWELHKDHLSRGETVSFRPKGNSMRPKIKSGQLVTVSPEIDDIEKGDIVFCKVKGSFYVHLLSATKTDQYQISNNKGRVNGWISKKAIFGKVIKVED